MAPYTLAERYRPVFYPEHKDSIPPKCWHPSIRQKSSYSSLKKPQISHPQNVSFVNFVERTQHIPVLQGGGEKFVGFQMTSNGMSYLFAGKSWEAEHSSWVGCPWSHLDLPLVHAGSHMKTTWEIHHFHSV
jgi:hypothetical protein